MLGSSGVRGLDVHGIMSAAIIIISLLSLIIIGNLSPIILLIMWVLVVTPKSGE